MSHLALAPTPGGARLVDAVAAATARARSRYPALTPASVYLRPDDALAAGLRPQHFAKNDPPRVAGLPIRLIFGTGRSRLYCLGGTAISIHGDLQP